MKDARIALYLPRLSRYGGAEGFTWRLAERLQQEGAQIDYICARAETEAPEGVNVVTVGRPPLTAALKAAWYAYATNEKRKAGGYDLNIGMGKVLGAEIVRDSGGPLSLFWELSNKAWESGFAREWKMLRRRIAPVNHLQRALEIKQLKEAKILVAVSHKVRDWFFQEYPWMREKDIRIVYNLPDLNRFAPPDTTTRNAARERFGVKAGEKAVSFAGTNFPLKGLLPLIRAMHLLPDNHVLLVAGGRNPGKFAAEAEQLGIASRIRFLGKVSDMEGLYHASDAFCLPSYYDTCSNAVLEALASGVPAISTATNGSSYFLPESRVIQDVSNHEEIARRIESALKEGGAEIDTKGVACGLEPYVDIVGEYLNR